jgi:hypothetical protein
LAAFDVTFLATAMMKREIRERRMKKNLLMFSLLLAFWVGS